MPLERRMWLEQQILSKKRIDIEAISKKLKVSAMTIRRDLATLEKEGKVIRTHGGAISPDVLTKEIPYASKRVKNNIQKKDIALKALELVDEYSTIILDSGTTTYELAKLLKNKTNLTIITNDVKIANELLDSPSKVIMIGGELQQEVGSVLGSLAQNMLRSIHVDICFMGAQAIDSNIGVTSPTFDKSTIKQLMIQSADKTWILADASKFSKYIFSFVCHLSMIEGIITDNKIEKNLVLNYQHHTRILIGGD